MINGLDLFSGIGGITLALSEWVRPLAYCEIDTYAQGVLMSRMEEGRIAKAPIWTDVTTLRGGMFPKGSIDIIYGGFPCQDISVANTSGKGLEGKRSGLFYQIMRLCDELRPSFIFLENVPNIIIRGLVDVTGEITKRGYDCRWKTLSAAEVGANHIRNRWWLLAYANNERGWKKQEWIRGSSHSSEFRNVGEDDTYTRCRHQGREDESKRTSFHDSRLCEEVSDTLREGLERFRNTRNAPEEFQHKRLSELGSNSLQRGWWTTEPDVGRVVNGLPFRVDRIKALGNSVVPLCAKEAFKELLKLEVE